MFERLNYVMSGEDGASTLEIVGWMLVCMIVIGVLVAFSGSIRTFINKATGNVGKMTNEMNNRFSLS